MQIILVQSGEFVVMRIKFAFVNNFKFPLTQKLIVLYKMSDMKTSWAAHQDGRFSEIYIFVILDITAFSKSNLHCFIAFCARTGRLDSDMFIKKF